MLPVECVTKGASSPTESHGMFGMGIIPGVMARCFHGNVSHLLELSDGLSSGGVKTDSGRSHMGSVRLSNTSPCLSPKNSSTALTSSG